MRINPAQDGGREQYPMRMKISHCAIVVVSVSLISSGARATAIDISAEAQGALLPTAPWASVLTFDDLPVGELQSYEFAGGTLTGNGTIEDDSLPGKFAEPAGDPTRYFTVSYPSATGATNLAFSSPENYFGLYWGSMDNYNTITFLKRRFSQLPLVEMSNRPACSAAAHI